MTPENEVNSFEHKLYYARVNGKIDFKNIKREIKNDAEYICIECTNNKSANSIKKLFTENNEYSHIEFDSIKEEKSNIYVYFIIHNHVKSNGFVDTREYESL